MEWIPIVFVVFKALVLGTGMFYAVKWHYDQGDKNKDKKLEKRAVLLAAAKVTVVFIVLLMALGYATYVVIKKLGLDWNFSA